MLPYLAQGANSSLEDGAVLGGLLSKMSRKSSLPDILRLYETLRKKRGEAIARETFKQVCLRTMEFAMCYVANEWIFRGTISTCLTDQNREREMRYLLLNNKAKA